MVNRFLAVRAGIYFLSIIAVARLFGIQILSHKEYSAQAYAQYANYITIPAKRGEILTSDGYPLASNQVSYLLYVEPKRLKDRQQLLQAVLSVLPQEIRGPEQARLEKLLDYNLHWIALEHNLAPEQKRQLEEFDLPGVGFEEEPVRFYPEGSLATHVLGYVAEQEDGTKGGYYGIEAAFNGDLAGRQGKVTEETDALGLSILTGGFSKIKPVDGKNIHLTIDRTVQYIIEKKLKEGVEKYDAGDGVIIVMNPLDGSVLGMAVYPNYDPQNIDFQEPIVSEKPQRKAQEHRNLAISYLYEPGSVLKPLTLSAAIDSGKATPETTYHDPGYAVYSGYTIKNWDGKALGSMNLISLLQKSNNIGAAWVGHLVGREALSSYFRKFGIGAITGISLEGEEASPLRNAAEITDIDLATMSFGQGILATPLQVLNAFNAIANGGVLYKPRIVSSISDTQGGTDIEPKEVGRVIKRATADTMVEMLIQAVDGGESQYFNLKNYLIAGKTGTAQIAVPGGYDPNKTNATFVGFLPKSNKFSMIVKLREPQSSIYAAETAVPLWMETAGELAKYYSIAPDR
ncbi:penicillin-binding protein 2 [Patescibacteria group bacterium]|nr:penicillin-binding protein 2 [Patescibacteria group bacterium]